MRIRPTQQDRRGASWIAPEPPRMQRASHALVVDGGVWLVDPVDGEGLPELLEPLGPVRGVVQLLDRHPRDCAALAERHGVPLLQRPAGGLPGTDVEAVVVADRPWWREVALWWPAERTLVVAEALGTTRYCRAGDAPLGVHPGMRLTPPRALTRFPAHRLLPGHGPPVEGAHVAGAIRRAVDRSIRDVPSLLLGGREGG